MDTRTELLTEIATFQNKLKMADSKIGQIALNDPKFVARLRDGRRCWPETAQKVRDFMAAAYTHITTADGTVIIRDVATGISASGATLSEAYAELRRLIDGRQVAA
ncbi:hypothetical protein [Mesorhizobium sp.]|uniref:hypothetical protein n=1 Tax=Mesorhizobium sp. TaxID=1871066 RepID=UPI001220561A|nr:hypothetical protein [Mesorhizobium sp.]TIQ96693.1 MAG: hypothetical protein E5X36_19230 [Mesorhizobium sp.]